MSADDHTSNDPAGSSDDNRRTLPDGVPPAVIITGHQIECWAGRVLTSGELARLDERIATSAIPQLIAQIVAQFDNEPIHESAVFTRRRINYHRDDAGDWCPWSLTALAATANGRCPGGCAKSTVEADDGDDDEPHNLTDCQLCGGPGRIPVLRRQLRWPHVVRRGGRARRLNRPRMLNAPAAGVRPANALGHQRHPRVCFTAQPAVVQPTDSPFGVARRG